MYVCVYIVHMYVDVCKWKIKWASESTHKYISLNISRYLCTYICVYTLVNISYDSIFKYVFNSWVFKRVQNEGKYLH